MFRALKICNSAIIVRAVSSYNQRSKYADEVLIKIHLLVEFTKFGNGGDDVWQLKVTKCSKEAFQQTCELENRFLKDKKTRLLFAESWSEVLSSAKRDTRYI